MTRLFKENGGETLTPEGDIFADIVRDAIKPLIQLAVEGELSLRDAKAIIDSEVASDCAIEQIRRGIEERRQQRLANQNNRVTLTA